MKLNILNQAVVNPEFSFRNDMPHTRNTNHIALLGHALYLQVRDGEVRRRNRSRIEVLS